MPIREDQLHNWDLLKDFRARVLPLPQAKAAASAEEQEARRTLFADDYFCLFLFAILNPIITSMRALCHVSHCQKMRQVSQAPVSLGSFSEAQHAFGPDILEQVLRDLAKENQGLVQGGDPRVRAALSALTAVDGTVLRAVARMAWAPAAGPGQSIRLHLHFNVLDQIPAAWPITPGHVSERKILAQTVQPGAMIVADRAYGHDFALLAKWKADGIDFVLRLYNNLVVQHADLLPRPWENPVSGFDRSMAGCLAGATRLFPAALPRPIPPLSALGLQTKLQSGVSDWI